MLLFLLVEEQSASRRIDPLIRPKPHPHVPPWWPDERSGRSVKAAPYLLLLKTNPSTLATPSPLGRTSRGSICASDQPPRSMLLLCLALRRDSALNKFGREASQSIELLFGPAVLYRDVLTFDISRLGQTSFEIEKNSISHLFTR